jgi:glucokinase
MTETAIGIDIGATYTKYGIMDRDGNLLASGRMSTNTGDSFDDYILNLSAQIQAMMAPLLGKIRPRGIGVGAPNANFFRGTIEYSVNLHWGDDIPFVKTFRRHIDLPMAVTNDANAAALGEMFYGGARGMKDFIVITLGTGLGSGIVVNGELVYGHDGFAGEIGHTIVEPGGRSCGCGRSGCLETYASATGLVRTAFELMSSRSEPSTLREIPSTAKTAEDNSRAALEGDSLALLAFDYTGRILGMKLADAVAHTSPEAIFLFGGLVNAGDLILEPTKKYMDEFILSVYRGKVKLLPSQMAGMNAAIAGACALVWQEI